VKTGKTTLKSPVSAAPSGKPVREARVAELSPDTWPNEIAAIEKMRLSELPQALRRYLGCRFPDVRLRLLGLLFQRWAMLDRQGALAALKGIPSPQMKARAMREILQEWVKTDEAAAWQHVVSMNNDSVLQEESIELLLALCAKGNPTNYVEWARQLQDPFLRGKAFGSIAQAWAKNDPKAALEAAFVEEDAFLRQKLFELVSLQQNTGINHVQVLDRILELPDAAERSRLIGDNWIVSHFNRQPAEAMAWIQQHADQPELQKAASGIGALMAGSTKNVELLHDAALTLPAGPVRDSFAASAAISWLWESRRLMEAEELLSICGPCFEREFALRLIGQQRRKMP
jgi:hypothetical protein